MVGQENLGLLDLLPMRIKKPQRYKQQLIMTPIQRLRIEPGFFLYSCILYWNT